MTLRSILISSATLLFSTTAALAGVGEINNPKVTKDEFEAQYNATRVDDKGTSHNKQTHRAEFEYGFTDSFAAEIGFKFEDSRAESFDLNAIYLEGKYQFTDQKDGYWLSSAGLGEWVFNTDNGPDVVEAKLLAQRDQKHFRHRGNLILEREVGGGSNDETELATRWYSRWNASKHFKPGFEWHAEYGTLDHIKDWDDQEHYIGPALFGDLFEVGDMEVEYELSHTFGITDASEQGVTRLMIEFKKEF